jgi:hypothetical protein
MDNIDITQSSALDEWIDSISSEVESPFTSDDSDVIQENFVQSYMNPQFMFDRVNK